MDKKKEVIYTGAIQERANKMAEKAVTVGIVRNKGNTYRLDFNFYTNNYDVYETKTNDYIGTFRTYKITQAKKWLREFLSDEE